MVSGEPSDPDTIRVLHVDDEPNQLEFVKQFLKFDPAIHVESASSPEEAQRLLEEGFYDCIVSDYQMPVMDGIELARRIRETSSIPFIIYTGRGSEEVASVAFTAGVDDYVRKELDPGHYEVLAKRVRAAVEKQRAEETVARARANQRARFILYYFMKKKIFQLYSPTYYIRFVIY